MASKKAASNEKVTRVTQAEWGSALNIQYSILNTQYRRPRERPGLRDAGGNLHALYASAVADT